MDPVSRYKYDALYRLTEATGRELSNLSIPTHKDFENDIPCPDTDANAMRNYTQKFAYDAIGNMQYVKNEGQWTRNYHYMDNNYLLNHDSHSQEEVYKYDSHGNMIEITDLYSMNWDCKGQLISAGNETFISYYHYDREGNRTRKTIVNGNIIEEYYYICGLELYRKYNNFNLETERKEISVSDDEKVFLRMQTRTTNGQATTVSRYQYDNHLGSACLELDDMGQIISYEEYYPFGSTSYRLARNETEISLKRYKYCGKERDEETGLYYYGMRYYADWLWRFLSVDPLQFEYPELTPYQYASNNPVTMIDLDGLEGIDSNIKRNLYIIFRSEEELKNEYSKTKDTTMGSYEIIVSNDIKIALEKAKNYLYENKVDNIVLDAHGAALNTERRGLLSPDQEEIQQQYIHMGNVRRYLKGGEEHDKNTENQNENIKALKDLFSYVEEGGKFVFLSCKLGLDEIFIKDIYKLTDTNINLYFNQDFSPSMTVDGILQLWTGKMPLSMKNNEQIGVDNGWIRINKDEGPIKLKNISDHSGSIYINTKQWTRNY